MTCHAISHAQTQSVKESCIWQKALKQTTLQNSMQTQLSIPSKLELIPNIEHQISTGSRKPHPQHVTTLTMNKRNENLKHHAEATPNIGNPKSWLINIHHTHPETTNPQSEQQACQSKLGWHVFNSWTSQLPTTLSRWHFSVMAPHPNT